MTTPTRRRELVGLVPAAGRASRLGEQPVSKEIWPIPGEDGGPPRPACHDLLTAFARAGVDRTFILLREGKWDVPGALGDGGAFSLRLAYLVLAPTPGVPFTLAAASPFVGEADVALGFPDILLRPHDLLLRLRAHHDATASDCSLALVPCDRPWASDIVECAPAGRIERIVVKPDSSAPGWTWVLAVWAPRFTDFLTRFVQERRERPVNAAGGELHAGDVINAAIEHGLRVTALAVEEGRALDLGTPESLLRATAGDWLKSRL